MDLEAGSVTAGNILKNVAKGDPEYKRILCEAKSLFLLVRKSVVGICRSMRAAFQRKRPFAWTVSLISLGKNISVLKQKQLCSEFWRETAFGMIYCRKGERGKKKKRIEKRIQKKQSATWILNVIVAWVVVFEVCVSKEYDRCILVAVFQQGEWVKNYLLDDLLFSLSSALPQPSVLFCVKQSCCSC